MSNTKIAGIEVTTAPLEPISEEMLASNPIALPTSEANKALIDKFNETGEAWFVGRATYDCVNALA